MVLVFCTSIVRATNSNVNYKNFRHISTPRTLSLFLFFFALLLLTNIYMYYIFFRSWYARQAWSIMNEWEQTTKNHIHVYKNSFFLLLLYKRIKLSPTYRISYQLWKLFNNSLSIQTRWRPKNLYFCLLLLLSQPHAKALCVDVDWCGDVFGM